MPYSHPQPIDRQSGLKRIRHMVPGAMALAGIAGFINTVALGFFHAPVSHMSGTVSRMGVDVAQGGWRDVITAVWIVFGFVLGAALSGIIVGAWKLIPGRSYGVAMMIEGLLLAVACGLLMEKVRFALPLLSMACGLQNAMSSSYCGLIIRTTHVTGMVTDVGVMLGHWIRHGQVQGWKLLFLLAILLSFTAGGIVGGLADMRFGPVCLALPAFLILLAGAIYWFVHHHGLVDVVQDLSPTTPPTASFPNHQKDS